MKRRFSLLLAWGVLLPPELMAACLNEHDVKVYGQTAYVNKKTTLWQIEGKNPYSAENVYHDLAIHYQDGCALIEDKLDVDFAVSGLAYYPYKGTGAFETDDHRLRVRLDKVRFSYTANDSVRLEMGKLRPKVGLFYLKSPASLLNNYYGGFKATRINDPGMQPLYTESFWGALLAQDTPQYSLSLTVAPQIKPVEKEYESSENWDARQRSNASDRYMLTYTDYRFSKHTPSASLMVGNKKSVALSDSISVTPQFMVNAEMAYHFQQQWRHLHEEDAENLENYAFPSALYSAKHQDGVELALGAQYTTDQFSQFGIEYYFQSEGYSASQWKKQTDLVKFLNQKTQYAPLDRAFEAYKYLMASEIYNTSSQGNLLGKHYMNAYGSILMDDQSTFQPYAVINMRDRSTTVGLNFNKPLNKQLELYIGFYSAQGKRDSEFGLFGQTLGTYLGFKYHL